MMSVRPLNFYDRRRAPRRWWDTYAYRFDFAWNRSDWDLVEVLCGIHAVLWGLVCCTVVSFASNPAFAQLEWFAAQLTGHITAERLWGSVMLALGLAVFHGYGTNRTRLRQRTALALGMFWTFLSLCYATKAPHTPAIVTAPMAAVAAFVVYRRIRGHRDVRAFWRRVEREMVTAPMSSALGTVAEPDPVVTQEGDRA